jgi:glycerol uptake facilitator-like aquaporin
MDKNLRPYLAELIGTFAFVFLSAGAVCVDQVAAISASLEPGLVVTVADAETAEQASKAVNPVLLTQPRLSLTGIALTTGLVLAAALAITLPISGGYLNPVVPLVLWVFKRMNGSRATGLIAAQLLGAVVAGMLLRVVLGGREDALVAGRLGTPHLNLDAFGAVGVGFGAILRGIAIELVLTFLLIFAIFGLALDPRAPRLAGGWATRLAPLWIGLLVVAATFVGFGLTGAALNPARWLGTAVWELTVVPLRTRGPFADHSVYWIGPILGGLIAGALYNALILPPEREEHGGHEAAASTGARPVGSTLYKARK